MKRKGKKGRNARGGEEERMKGGQGGLGVGGWGVKEEVNFVF